jgi:TolB-like protein
VLLFANLDGDPRHDYFSDGIADDIRRAGDHRSRNMG